MKNLLLSALVLLGLLATPGQVLARVSADQAAAVARQSVAGRVLAVEKINASGQKL